MTAAIAVSMDDAQDYSEQPDIDELEQQYFNRALLFLSKDPQALAAFAAIRKNRGRGRIVLDYDNSRLGAIDVTLRFRPGN